MSPENSLPLHAVILAGGSGTRLWPLSTKKTPKQFLRIGSERSLIQGTADRLRGLVPAERLWVVGGKNHERGLSEHLAEIPKDQILIEPQAKNTAAAIALAAVQLRARDPRALMAVLPADHSIPERDWLVFRSDLALGARLAQEKSVLVTLGLKPRDPATGYGYIEKGEALAGENHCFRVRSFREKPDVARAQEYFSSGNFFWNSGMFLWSADTYLSELTK